MIRCAVSLCIRVALADAASVGRYAELNAVRGCLLASSCTGSHYHSMRATAYVRPFVNVYFWGIESPRSHNIT